MEPYDVLQVVQAGPAVSICRALRVRDGRRVLLKVQRTREGRESDHLRTELEVGGAIDPAVGLRPLEMTTVEGSSALVLDDFEGRPLEQLMGKAIDVRLALRIGIALAHCLDRVHASGFVHGDIEPRNVFFDARSGEVKLTGFGIARSISGEHWGSGTDIEGTLPYASPEQAGRIHRPIDARSDLYSVGVVLYEMLVGERCNLAEERGPLRGLPKPVSDIVLRLLKKLPEERYQTAAGLSDDLTRCLAAWDDKAGAVALFDLGRHDFSGQLRIPRRLYGRERETEVLSRAFERVTTRRIPGVVLVSGPDGIGKSFFARSIDEQVDHAGGLFIAGKFEQTTLPTPYSAITSALSDAVNAILSQRGAALQAWGHRLTQALGDFVQLAVDLVRPLECIVGKQTAVPDLALEGTQSRVFLVFRRLFSAFASDRPLVLFLDDLQWADVASSELIEHLVGQRDAPSRLLVVATHGDVGFGHPLRSFVSRLRVTGSLDEIVLPPLTRESVMHLCADALWTSAERVEPLADLVWKRSAGNPLCVTQLLKNLHRDRILVFDQATRAWHWDLDRIGDERVSDDVVERTLTRVRELPHSIRSMLELAACLGGPFDARNLSLVTRASVDEMQLLLRDAVAVGLLAAVGSRHRFLHDRIREAIYEGIPRERRLELHVRIGRALRDHLDGEELERRAFDVAAHLNLGAALIDDPKEREELAALDLLTGRAAQAKAAYASAAAYFAAGIGLLDPNAWQERYALTLGLHLESARCELLQGNMDSARRLANVVLEHARNEIDGNRARRIEIDIHMLNDDVAYAGEVALESLRALGHDLEARPTREMLLAAEREVWDEVDGRSIESLIDLPVLKDPALEATLEMLDALLPVAYVTDPALHCVVACRIVTLSFRHGIASASMHGCAALALELFSTLDRPLEARRLGEVARCLSQRREFRERSARVLAVVGGCLAPHTASFSAALEVQRSAYRAATELGDLMASWVVSNFIVVTRIARGDDLDEVEREARRLRDLAESARSLHFALTLGFELAFVRSLQTRSQNRPLFVGTELDEHALEGHPAALPIARAWFHVGRVRGFQLHGDPSAAIEEAARARPLLWALRSLTVSAMYHLHAGLAHAALASDASGAERDAHVRALTEHETALSKWAETSTENFRSMHLLLAAERCRLARNADEAIPLYERAIRSAHDNGLLSAEALAYETASGFYRRLGLEAFADIYLRDARACYLKWGAHAKVRALDAQTPHIVNVRTLSSLTGTVSTRQEDVDQLSILKASQVLSSETVRSRLLLGLTQLLAELAGARKAVFLSVNGEGWTIESASGQDDGVPESIVNEVIHSGERLLIHDAWMPGRYSADPYVLKRPPRSIVCLPIVRHAKLLGIVYLENDVFPAAFTEDKLAVLELLVEQAGISLENANLHREQLREMAERQEAEAKLRSILDNMVDAVLVCDRSARITFANPAGARLVGFERSNQAPRVPVEQLAARFAILHPDGTRFTTDELPLLRALAGEVLSSVDMTLRNDSTGRTAHLRVSAAPLQDDLGAIDGAVLVAVNVTEAIELDRLKEQFLRLVAHELKTPTAIVKGYADALRRRSGDLPETQRRLVTALVRGANRIDRLITALLIQWQLQAGRLVLAVDERVDLAALVELVVDRFELEAERRVSVVAPRSVVIAADRQLLGEAILNLVDNALRYSPAGADVAIEVNLLGEWATIAVTDKGIGIPPTKQARLFEPFFRAHADTPSDAGGLGLGLYVSRAIAMLHGGRIEVESKEGEGSTFRLRLPLRAAGKAFAHADSPR